MKKRRLTGILLAAMLTASVFQVQTLDVAASEAEEVTETAEAEEETAEAEEETAEAEDVTAEAEDVTAEAEDVVEAEPETPVAEETDEEVEEPESSEDVILTESEDVCTDIDLPDSDTLFAGYVEQVLGGQTKPNTFLRYNAPRYSRLSEADKRIYTVLKPKIQEIAAGTADNTRFTFQVSDVHGKATDARGKVSFTLQELGLTSEATTQEIKEAIFGNLSNVVRSMMLDMPYEFYWFDKTAGYGISYSGPSVNGTTVTVGNSFSYSFRVAEAYAATNSSGNQLVYQTDKTLTSATTTARKNVDAIVAKHSAKNDPDKLTAYRDEICIATDYNYAAAYGSSVPYGDPWQLIWVFDGDDTTNVVCEGYSKAFQLLCNLSTFQSYRIECHTVYGDTSGGHMWNVVRMDNGYNYLVDVTNADTGEAGKAPATERCFLKGDPNGTATGYTVDGISYTYRDEIIEMYSARERTLSPGASYAEDLANNKPDAVDVSVTGVRLDHAAVDMKIGETRQLIATILPSDASIQDITFSSGNTAVATVTQDGLVTAKGHGSTVITVKTKEGNKTATCSILVAKPVSSVSVSPAGVTVKEGATAQLSATVLPADATDKSVTWSSSDTSVATVSQSGLVTGKGKGTATIKVVTNDGAKEASCTVRVLKPVSGVSLSQTRATVEKGSTVRLSATVSPSDASDRSVTWSSSNTSVATVSQSGLVTANGEGTVTIKVRTTDGAKEASCIVTVKGGEWIEDGTGWWYRRSDGTYPVSSWEYINGDYYRFDGNGYMQTGWVFDGNAWYYMDGSGRMQTGWVKSGNTWYYMYSPTGNMATGWVKVDDTWYYMDGSGAMQTGWVNTGAWYYMDGSGAMRTGWIWDGAWYYMDGNGAMLSNTSRDIDGKTYHFNGSGVCTNP